MMRSDEAARSCHERRRVVPAPAAHGRTRSVGAEHGRRSLDDEARGAARRASRCSRARDGARTPAPRRRVEAIIAAGSRSRRRADGVGLAGLLHDIDRAETDADPSRHGIVGHACCRISASAKPWRAPSDTMTRPVCREPCHRPRPLLRPTRSTGRSSQQPAGAPRAGNADGRLRRLARPKMDRLGDRQRAECASLGWPWTTPYASAGRDALLSRTD